MIKSATLPEIPDVLKITNACRLHMEFNGIYQWTEHYPNENQFVVDTKRKELYLLKDNNIVIGCVVVTTLMNVEYEAMTWLTNNENNLYIHRLAVHPDYQGKGYAQQLMTFAEDHARSNGYTSVRLDTFSQNERNQLFYERRGYKRLGDIHFPDQSEHPFHCYELLL